jgi:hypothetical protein
LADIDLAFKDCFKSSDSDFPCFVYIRAADLAFSRSDVEHEEDSKLNDLRTKITIEILDRLDKIAEGRGNRSIVIMSLSEAYSEDEFDEFQGIPFFFASERIDKIISIS